MLDERPHSEQQFWDRAIALAGLGRGAVSPNPVVGAVLVRDGRLIGEGWHKRRGDLHAERVALADAASRGNDSRGATAYVTLEPCAHTGRQPPCVDALIEAGVSRVLIGCDDPTAKTSGVGPDRLAAAGVKVDWAESGVALRCRELIQDFRKRSLTGRPLVALKMAMSLDGKVATRTGEARWISGPESRDLVHHWRAECDAVAVGSGTFRADDPRLTARPGGLAEVRQPVRVVFDSVPSVTPDAALFDDIETAPVVVVTGLGADAGRLAALETAGAEIVIATGRDRVECFLDGLQKLGRREISSVLLEGGPTLAGVALEAGEVDRVEVFIAPLIVGGGRAATEGPGPDRIADATRVPGMLVSRVGQDVLVSGKIKVW
ncbi:MAG: bifunctional diaminohydroxyphosphoribosylaminopyrimidine deaminase/5-amino-6-(5-phosphoribosylamino)uracil reductase RibD [Acidobacteriota bacterium]